MSIEAQIKALCASGLLEEYALPGRVQIREFYASETVRDFLRGPWSQTVDQERAAQLRVDIEEFLAGRIMPTAMDSRNPALLKRLIAPPQEVWEMCSIFEKPGIRVFGRFALKNVFIALAHKDRIDLGNVGSRQWRYWMRRCEHEWRVRFPNHEPLTGSLINDYLSHFTPIY